MSRRLFSPVLAVACLCALAGCGRGEELTFNVPPPGPPVASLTLLLSGTTSGNLEPCDCPGRPRGGLSRRLALMRRVGQRVGPTVALDAGDLLGLEIDPLLDRAILAGYGRMGYAAVCPGDQDLDRGADDFLRVAAAEKLPLVCCNVTFGGKRVGRPWRRIERGGRVVLVTGVLGPAAAMYIRPPARDAVAVIPPADAVRAALADHAAAARRRGLPPPDLVVLLAHLDPGERQDVLGSIAGAGGVDLAVVSTEVEKPAELQHVGRLACLFAPPGGKELLEVRVEFPAPGRPHVAAVASHSIEQDRPRDPELWKLYQGYEAKRQEAERH